MGMMVEGVWRDVPRDTKSTGGEVIRADRGFRDRIAAAEVEPGRYWLYVSKACPWAHRTLVVRALKGLEKEMPGFYGAAHVISHGWEYADGGIRYLYELYARTKPDYTGRVTVPVL